ncbi:MAG: sugar phosphate isomerase/epimerase [Ruminococcaceae bacterium]|nr:sugar phosphate isomerase/epimerase [Oscillospiraceae bacterium]
MKIGTCVTFDGVDKIAKKLKDLQDHGFTTCQLLCWDPALWTPDNAQRLKEALDTAGVTPSAFWCGWTGPAVWDFYEGPLTLGLVPQAYRAMRIQQLCDGADFAKQLGITDVVTHMGFIPENPNDPVFAPFCEAVRTVARHLRENGQYLLFESGQETPVTMLRCFEEVGMDNLGVNLDTANLILYGRGDPVAALEVIGRYVRNLHAKDGRYPTNGHQLGQETPVGQGMVDFRAVFKKLHELGYDAHVTIEREITGEQQLTDILHAREYLAGIIKEEYGGNVVC